MGHLFSLAPWLGSVRQWHWISSAICLVGMLLFAITGITLNHAGQIEARPTTHTIERTVTDTALEAARAYVANPDFISDAPLPRPLRQWLDNEAGIRVGGRHAEWNQDELYLSMPQPGADAWLSIDLTTGDLLYEGAGRGAIAYLNDLHKGRNTGTAWAWFLDGFSVACIVFCVTGLILLFRHSRTRPSTWPLVGLGLVIPLLIALLFIHS